MDKRDKHQQENAGGEKPNALIHDQVDHEHATPNPYANATADADNRQNVPMGLPARPPSGPLNRGKGYYSVSGTGHS
jgi:hypothetical protein